MPCSHQQRADVGVAEAQRAVVVGHLGDLPATGTAPCSTEISRTMRPQPAGVLEGVDVEAACLASRNVIRFSEARLQAVSSRNMYSEHGLDARIGPTSGRCASR